MAAMAVACQGGPSTSQTCPSQLGIQIVHNTSRSMVFIPHRTPARSSSTLLKFSRNSTSGRFVVRADSGVDGSSTTTAAVELEVEVGGITEVDKDTFWPIAKSAGDKVVVLDMYTQWCGPCKLILPKIQKLAASMEDVIFCKLDCNQDNKALAKELGIKVVPTFKIFKDGSVVESIAGAKYDALVTAINKHRGGS